MGISNTDRIIIYCCSDLISSCRAWFQFLYFGHNPKTCISIKWRDEKMEIRKKKSYKKKKKIVPSKYIAKENKNMIKIKSEVDKNIKEKKFTILDARSKNRFLGLESEPRPGV